MQRRTFLTTLAASAVGGAWAHAQRPASGLMSQSAARRHGLRRAWVTQIAIDRQRDRVASQLLHAGTLFIQSRQGLVHALDAETGGTQWISQIGHRDHPSTTLAANDKIVAVANGTTLYVVDRRTGHPLRQYRIEHIPSQDVAVAQQWIYVPTTGGHLEVFPIEPAEELNAWNNASLGRIDTPPLVTRTSIVWGTHRGFVYFCSKDRSNVTFRLDTRGPISAPLGYWPPMVLAASRDGYVYSIDERTGEELWRYPLGEPINEAPLAIDGLVYLLPQSGGMHCVTCADGALRWTSSRVHTFISASAARIYAEDRFGDTVVLDSKSGAHLDTISTASLPIKYTNLVTDRLYMGTSTGMFLCLREEALPEPLIHELPPEKPTEAAEEAAEAPVDPAADPLPMEDNGNP